VVVFRVGSLSFLLVALTLALASTPSPVAALASYPTSAQDAPGSSTGSASVAVGVPDYAFVNDNGLGFGGTNTNVFGVGESAVFAFPWPLLDVAGEDDLLISAFVGGFGATDNADVRVEVSSNGVSFVEVDDFSTQTGRTTYPFPQERNFDSVKHFGVDFAGENDVTHVRLTVTAGTAEGLRLDALEGIHPDVDSDYAFELRLERYRNDASERFLVRIKNLASPGGEPVRVFSLEKLPVNEWMEDTIHSYVSSAGDFICVNGCLGDGDGEPGVHSATHEWSVDGIVKAPTGVGLAPGHYAGHERHRNIDIDTGVANSYLDGFSYRLTWANGVAHAFDHNSDVVQELGELYQKYTYFSASPSLSGPRPVDYYEFIASGQECSDGFDNDGDGAVDHPADLGCDDAADEDENAPGFPCDDGIDNDGDFLIDFPADPGCRAVWSVTEEPECSNGAEDDSDGLVDYPADPGCPGPWGTDESPACNDGLDNDGDQLIDLADPQCTSASFIREQPGCGLGFELALALPLLLGLRRRQSQRAA
jgi:hypothetical protein